MRWARVNTLLLNRSMATGSMVSLGFAKNIGRASFALIRFGTVGIFNAIKGMGAYSGERIIMDEAVISLQKTKSIVTTQIVGGTGTVKEYISDADIDITISAALVATDYADNIIDEYPEEGIKQLRKVIDTPETIKATSKFLELFEIDRMVIKEVSITQATHSNRQEITIKALSDYDYTIYNEEA
jgi:isopentenyl diphosphate isomerase/L-lactate dehydrogenase-like FMN-dependent dehydrogenase